MLSEKARQIQEDVNLGFIDYTKAFDKVRHKVLLEQFNDVDKWGKDIRIKKNMYWQ